MSNSSTSFQEAASQQADPVNAMLYLGVDAGGTFTDFVLIDGAQWRIHKVLSTPKNPAQAILQGIEELGLETAIANKRLCVIHGSTVATNAVLERKGARTVYVTNKGFSDILTIGRQARKELYNLNQLPPTPPVPRELCLEVDCRRDATGLEIKSLDEDSILSLKAQIAQLKPEAIAINLLFSFLNDEEEIRLQKALEDEYFVSRSSFVLPKYKEYERGMATWLNATLGPKVKHYLSHLRAELNTCPLSIMQSSGGTIAAEQAAQRAVNLLLSGPAGGLSAVRYIAQQCQLTQIMSFDMGGTSTDVALMDGHFELSDEGKVNDWPVAIPMLKMETIGAGGGSIAWVDEGKLLHVGPQSAGSMPGPVCYQKGGMQVTVTDANLLLGRLRPEAFLGGKMHLDIKSAQTAMTKLAEHLLMPVHDLAKGVIELAEQQMVKALHSISIQKGHNPNDFTLCCFGGAGGMHVCSLAEKMHMSRAIIPENSGVLSAYGMLRAQRLRQFSKTHLTPLSSSAEGMLDTLFEELETQGRAEFAIELAPGEEIAAKRSLDLRYQGQSFTLNIPFSQQAEEQFHQAHKQQYGHCLDTPVELVNLCLELSSDSEHAPLPVIQNKPQEALLGACSLPFETQEAKIYQRENLNLGQELTGPAIIIETVSTTWLKAGWVAKVDEFRHLQLYRA